MRISILILFLGFYGFLNAQKIEYKTAINTLQKIQPKDYPESSTIEINNREVVLDEQCLSVSINESYTRILTEQGKQRNAQIYFSYDSNYDTVIVDVIEVIKVDGKVNKLDPSEVLKKMSRSAFGGFSNIYTETGWLLVGNIPNLEVGDIIHKKQTQKVHKSRMENNYFDRISVESYSTIYKSWYQLTIPKSRKINLVHINKKDNMIKIDKSENSKNTVYTLTRNYIPQMIYEPNMDSKDFYAYYIMFTTVERWEDISTWYYGLVKDHLKIDKAMKDKVAELTKDAKTKKEKIANIFYWVAQKIRYLGVDKEKNRPGYEPHDVTYTFETRGGVCRDKAALLVAMLREAGIPSDPILISSGYQLSHDAPVMWFNHAVAVSYDEKGEPEYFFDPTNETSKDFFPQYEEDDTYIIARKKGADLKIVPVSSPERNNTTIDMEFDIDNNNTAKGNVKISFSGLADTYIRGALMRYSPTKRKEMLQHMVFEIHPAAIITDYTITNPENKDKNIVLEAKFKINDFVDKDGNFVFIPYEASKLSLSFVYTYQMDMFSLSERQYPFKMSNTLSVDISQKIVFSNPLSNISLPEIEDFSYKGFVLKSSGGLSKDKKQLLAKVHFESNRLHFKQEEYQEMKNKLSALGQLEKLYIIGNSSVK